jgi:hypothetical protein
MTPRHQAPRFHNPFLSTAPFPSPSRYPSRSRSRSPVVAPTHHFLIAYIYPLHVYPLHICPELYTYNLRAHTALQAQELFEAAAGKTPVEVVLVHRLPDTDFSLPYEQEKLTALAKALIA